MPVHRREPNFFPTDFPKVPGRSAGAHGPSRVSMISAATQPRNGTLVPYEPACRHPNFAGAFGGGISEEALPPQLRRANASETRSGQIGDELLGRLAESPGAKVQRVALQPQAPVIEPRQNGPGAGLCRKIALYLMT